MENKTNEFEGKEILKSDEAARLLGITVRVLPKWWNLKHKS